MKYIIVVIGVLGIVFGLLSYSVVQARKIKVLEAAIVHTASAAYEAGFVDGFCCAIERGLSKQGIIDRADSGWKRLTEHLAGHETWQVTIPELLDFHSTTNASVSQ